MLWFYSTLQKLAADESRIGSSHPVSTPASIAEDEKRLELLRQKLTALRKERYLSAKSFIMWSVLCVIYDSVSRIWLSIKFS